VPPPAAFTRPGFSQVLIFSLFFSALVSVPPCLRGELRAVYPPMTSWILLYNAAAVKGFWMKGVSASIMPWRTTALSV